VAQYVESSDCVVLLGVLMTDINLGVYTAHLDPQRCIDASFEKLTIAYHTYENVRFDDFLSGLLAAGLPRWTREDRANRPSTPAVSSQGDTGSNDRVTVAQLFARIAAFLGPDVAVIADTGDAMFAAGDLVTYHAADFFAPAYYCSLGYAVPAAIGVQLANPQLRPLVLVGDGAFQMTGLELSTAARFGLNPIVIVLNNGGYATERFILDGPFNDITPWNYCRLPGWRAGEWPRVCDGDRGAPGCSAAAPSHTTSSSRSASFCGSRTGAAWPVASSR
jgi:indolepyruvate decarboxylase